MRGYFLIIFTLCGFCSFAQKTYVPNDSFEQALIDLGYDDVLDDYVLTANITTVKELNLKNKSIDIQFNQLDNLIGIEDFIALTYLDCSENYITSLNLENNQNLESLLCNNNQIKELNLSNNKKIKTIVSSNNPLIDLYLGYNSSVRAILSEYTHLSNLDLSQNGMLRELFVSNNDLINLDLTNKPFLKELDVSNNFSLQCIKVSDLQFAQANWFINNSPNASFSKTCPYDLTYIPDKNFERELIELGYDEILDGYVLKSKIETVASLNVKGKGIAQLTGIKDFKALKFLDCSNNKLTNLSLNKNKLLTDLNCENNNLIHLNLKNENNFNFSNFSSKNNPELTCITVDDANYSSLNWLNLDKQTSFSENCNIMPYTYIPDENFERTLINLGYDSGIVDNFVITSNISNISNLNISNKEISDLTGIENFTDLIFFNCSGNPVKEINLSKNSNLEELYCSQINSLKLKVSKNEKLKVLVCNQSELTSIDLKNNINLEKVFLNFNKLKNLDLNHNYKLLELQCEDNLLTNLFLNNNPELEYLVFPHNAIENINLKNNINLKQIVCTDNNLKSLDLSASTEITSLFAFNNDLESLNIKNNNNFSINDFSIRGNPKLFCVQVDDREYSLINWIDKDNHTVFSENCKTLSNEEFSKYELSLYPNPIKEKLIIHIQSDAKYSIFNVNGQKVEKGNLVIGRNEINTIGLVYGVYFLKIENQTVRLIKKIVKL